MEGYNVTASVHDYNNPGQKESQKLITSLNKIYNNSYKSLVMAKIYNNGLTRGVKIKIFCWSLQEVHSQISMLSLNITNLLEEQIFKGSLPSIRINLTKKL